jgi:hypothetical protein
MTVTTLSGVIIHIPTPTDLGKDDQAKYNEEYRIGFEAGLADGKKDGTQSVYDAIHRVPTPSEKKLISQLKSFDSIDINKMISDKEQEVFCNEVVTASVKEGIDIRASFPGCAKYLGPQPTKGGYKEDENGSMIYPNPIIHGGAFDDYSGYDDGYTDGYNKGYITYKTLFEVTLKDKGTFIPPSIESDDQNIQINPSGPTKIIPTESGPTKIIPTESGPTETTPTESGPSETIPTESGPSETIPTESGPSETSRKPSIITEAAIQGGGFLSVAKRAYKGAFKKYGPLLKRIKDKTISV